MRVPPAMIDLPSEQLRVSAEITILLAGMSDESELLHAADAANRLADEYPNCGLTYDDILELIMTVASGRHIALDTTRV